MGLPNGFLPNELLLLVPFPLLLSLSSVGSRLKLLLRSRLRWSCSVIIEEATPSGPIIEEATASGEVPRSADSSRPRLKLGQRLCASAGWVGVEEMAEYQVDRLDQQLS